MTEIPGLAKKTHWLNSLQGDRSTDGNTVEQQMWSKKAFFVYLPHERCVSTLAGCSFSPFYSAASDSSDVGSREQLQSKESVVTDRGSESERGRKRGRGSGKESTALKPSNCLAYGSEKNRERGESRAQKLRSQMRGSTNVQVQRNVNREGSRNRRTDEEKEEVSLYSKLTRREDGLPLKRERGERR